MNPAFMARQMADGMLSLSINSKLIPGTGRGLTIPWSLIPHISPDPRRFGFLIARNQHLDRRVISKQPRACPDSAADGVSQWFQQGGGFACPVRHSGTIQINAFTSIYLVLAVKWQMVCIFGDQNMGQKAWSRPAAFNRTGRHICLLNSLTANAGRTGPDDLVYDEPARHIFQFFGDIFAQNLEITATCITVLTRRQDLFLAIKVLRQRFALRFFLRLGLFGL